MKKEKIQTGTWLDQRHAYIMTFYPNGTYHCENVLSDIESFQPKGGSRSKQPWGPVETVKEKKLMERQKQQQKRYYQKLMALVADSDELYLFGPADTKLKFKEELCQHKEWVNKIKKVDTADSMTEGQRLAQVKNIFKIPS